MYLVVRDSSDDESIDVYTELVWPTKARPLAYSYLQSMQRNRQEEVKFTLMLPNVTEYLKSY
jgi:hypothetical protein